MIDGMAKGIGNSRYLKSAIPPNITFEQFVEMFRNGTFPVDFNGINMDGWDELPTWLNKANLLTDETASIIDSTNPPETVNESFNKLANNGNDLSSQYNNIASELSGKQSILTPGTANQLRLGNHNLSTAGTTAQLIRGDATLAPVGTSAQIRRGDNSVQNIADLIVAGASRLQPITPRAVDVSRLLIGLSLSPGMYWVNQFANHWGPAVSGIPIAGDNYTLYGIVFSEVSQTLYLSNVSRNIHYTGFWQNNVWSGWQCYSSNEAYSFPFSSQTTGGDALIRRIGQFIALNIRCRMNTTTQGVNIGTLPVGLRPVGRVDGACGTGNNINARYQIETNGAVAVNFSVNPSGVDIMFGCTYPISTV